MNQTQRCPLVSVVVPVYNAEKTLERCLNSIVAQRYENYELILVDDGSKDGSSDICVSYCKPFGTASRQIAVPLQREIKELNLQKENTFIL